MRAPVGDELAKLETMVPIVKCLYYHEEHGKRFLDHYEELGKADWVYCGNACNRSGGVLDAYDVLVFYQPYGLFGSYCSSCPSSGSVT